MEPLVLINLATDVLQSVAIVIIGLILWGRG